MAGAGASGRRRSRRGGGGAAAPLFFDPLNRTLASFLKAFVCIVLQPLEDTAFQHF